MHSPVVSTMLRDGTVTVRPRGEVDLGNAYQIREAVDRALIGPKPRRIVVDLGAVALIDSIGIGVLVSCYHAAAACRVPLTAVDPSIVVYRQLWVAGLVGLFGLATPRSEAEESAVA